jgi:6-phosphogluconolactonase
MGPDGHTASLFPGHPLLDESSKLIAHIQDSPKPPPTRVTFTYRLIAEAERVAFVATGEGKAAVIAHIFDDGVAPDARLPAARVRQAGGHQPPTWFVDGPACSKLPRAPGAAAAAAGGGAQ